MSSARCSNTAVPGTAPARPIRAKLSQPPRLSEFGAPRDAIGFGARDRDRLALSLHLLLSRLGRCRLAVLSRAPRGGARPAVRRSMPVARIWSRLLGSHRPHHCVWRPFESQLAPTTTPHPLPAELAHERYGDDIFEPRVTSDASQHLERLVLHSPFRARAAEVLRDAVFNRAAPPNVIIAALQQQRIDMTLDASVVDGAWPPGALLHGIS